MRLITAKEKEEVREIADYLEDEDRDKILKLINSYETIQRQNREYRIQNLSRKEEK